MGKENWDNFRQKVYLSTNYHCKACGVHKSQAKKHKWLEAHEDFEIDYKKKTMTLRDVVPLCHYCHQFIHSGLLYVNFQKNEDLFHLMQVLKHGFKIIDANNLKAFPFTIALADNFGVKTTADPLDIPDQLDWEGWSMVWDGNEYKSQFKTEKEWRKFYKR